MENLVAILGTFLVLTPVVIGIVAAFKDKISTTWVPVFSIIVGVVIAVLAHYVVPGLNWAAVVLGGIVLGLSACGLYSGTKTVVSA